ncbi:hypothetical protein ACO0LM_28385 [Undibacterium sp. Di26W]|uniref:hypothetical protein n=1 Tax=Undibacterium sp. Di26W TaxID=3413035 RepID=UPI003BF0684A
MLQMQINAALIHAYKRKPQQATCDVGLSVDEQAVLLKQDRKEISAFLDIPFKDFDLLDTTGIPLVAGCVLRKRPLLPDDSSVVFFH